MLYGQNVYLNEFKVGYFVGVSFIAPNTGYFSLNPLDCNKNIVLQIMLLHATVQNYYFGLNSAPGGLLHGNEVRPTGFDFTSGILTTVVVATEKDGFHIYQALFGFDSKLSITSVRHIAAGSYNVQLCISRCNCKPQILLILFLEIMKHYCAKPSAH